MNLRNRMIAIIMILSAGCGDEPDVSLAVHDTLPGGIVRTITPEPVERGRWALLPEVTVQPEAGSAGELIEPQEISFSDDGSLLVVDSRPAAIKVYDRAGNYLRTIGGEGTGPGEYRRPRIATRGDTLFLMDHANARNAVSLISDGRVIREDLKRQAMGMLYPITIDGRGRAYLRINRPYPFERPASPVLRIVLSDGTTDTTWIPDEPRAVGMTHWDLRSATSMVRVHAPGLPRSVAAIDTSGNLVLGWSSEYLLRVSATGLDTVRMFGRPAATVTISQSDKEMLRRRAMGHGMIERWASMSRLDQTEAEKQLKIEVIPDQAPAYEELWIDPVGRHWVRTWSTDTLTMSFDVFDHRGIWLDQVELPAPSRPVSGIVWSADRMAWLTTDDDDLPVVRVHRVERRN